MGRRKKKVTPDENYKKHLLKEGLKNQYREMARRDINKLFEQQGKNTNEIHMLATEHGISDNEYRDFFNPTELMIEVFAEIIVGRSH